MIMMREQRNMKECLKWMRIKDKTKMLFLQDTRTRWRKPSTGSKHHPALQWLPTKLAEWIVNNMQDEQGFPDKADPGRGWTPAELNSILQNHVVRNRDGCALTTFWCVEWESELYLSLIHI